MGYKKIHPTRKLWFINETLHIFLEYNKLEGRTILSEKKFFFYKVNHETKIRYNFLIRFVTDDCHRWISEVRLKW